jgi:squalene-hopene/tetraprenyl-beta-curcumene cyclase
MKFQLGIMTLAAALLLSAPSQAADIEDVEKAIEEGVEFLKKRQNEDGSFGTPIVGQTALAIRAMAGSHLQLREEDPVVKKAVEWVKQAQQPDGGIYNPRFGMGNYNTSIALMMFASLENPAYKDIMQKAANYVQGGQKKTDPAKDPNSGGFGYEADSNREPDLSNTNWALDALHEAEAEGVEIDPETYKRVKVFLNRLQNSDEVNDQPYAEVVDDGGAIYRAGESKAGKVIKRGRVGWRSYGSMTYGMLKSYVYAKLDENDPAVQGALKWIQNNYTVEENPGLENAGLYYYFVVFARAMRAIDKDTITDAYGEEHDWASDLADRMIKLQKDDGSWINSNERWYENDPVLVTSYSILALNEVRKQMAEEAAAEKK